MKSQKLPKCAIGNSCKRSCIEKSDTCRNTVPNNAITVALEQTIKIARPKYDESKHIDTVGLKELGAGAFGTVYSDGKGNAIKVEHDPNIQDDYDRAIVADSIKTSAEAQKAAAELGIAPQIYQELVS